MPPCVLWTSRSSDRGLDLATQASAYIEIELGQTRPLSRHILKVHSKQRAMKKLRKRTNAK